MFNNEEDVKLKLVYPLLRKLGFDEKELSFEDSFSLKVGRYTIRTDTKKQVTTQQPRLDILVRKNGQNLAVIEVKDDDIVLSDDDRDQAISYARLLDQIAPLAIVTNGKEWHVFNTITKQEIDTADFELPATAYRATLPDEDYYEALRHFLGYSQENLFVFCHKQNEMYMGQLKGSPTDRDKKYIEDLYERRLQAAEAFEAFVTSDARAFVLVGGSGSGKTCWICHTALEYARRGYPVLFYRAEDVRSGILKAVSEDLQWTLPPTYTEVEATKRLFDIFQQDCVLVFIDGLDEIETSVANQITKEFLRRTSENKVKLVATCKSDVWPDLLEYDGVPTELSSHVFKPNGSPGYYLGNPTSREYVGMLAKYKQFYGVSGRFEHDAFEEAKRNPFVLRVMFEVVAEQKQTVFRITTREFFDAYFEKLRKRLRPEERDKLQTTLLQVASTLFKHNAPYISLDVLRGELGASWQVPSRLLELNVLETQERSSHTYVGFYFKQFRDYIVAYKALRWQELSPSDFDKQIDSANMAGVQLEVLNLYYLLATDEHKRVLDMPMHENAKRYVTLYQQILDEHFSSFRRSFLPFRNSFHPAAADEIGFVGHIHFPTGRVFSYGFRPISDERDKVLLIPLTTHYLPRQPIHETRAFMEGALLLRSIGSYDWFRTINVPHEVIWTEIKPELETILEKGLLNESRCKHLLMERVLAACVKEYAHYFGFERHYATLRHPPSVRFGDMPDATKSYLPLNLEELKTAVLHGRALTVLYERRIQEKIDAGEIEVTWHENGITSHSGQLEGSDLAEVQARAWEMARAGKYAETNAFYHYWDDLERTLLNDIQSLMDMGVTQLERSQFLDWYDANRPNNIRPQTWDSERETSLLRYLQALCEGFLEDYQTLVKTNFPTLSNEFDLYHHMPLTVFVIVKPEPKEPGVFHFAGPGLDIYYCDNPEATKNQVFCLRPDDTEIEERVAEGSLAAITYKGQVYKAWTSESCPASYFISPDSDFTPFELVREMSVLRSRIYEELKHKLHSPFKKLAEEYGVPNERSGE